MVKENNKIGRRTFLVLFTAVGGYAAVGKGAAHSPSEAPSSENYDEILESMTGDGSENNPYTITDVVELQAIEGDLNANYILGNDIDASATSQWNDGKGFEPIADSSGDFNRDSFSGTLDGDGYSIKNLYIDRQSEDRVALFTGIGSGTLIKNLLLVNADISGNIRTGGIVGESWGTIDQSGIKDSNIHGDERVGGIVANANGRQGSLIKNAFSINTVVDGNERIGGVCGRDWHGEIRDSFTTHSEIIGDSTSSTIENIYYQNGSSDSIGVQLSKEEMEGSSASQNMSGLDFDSLWVTREDDYPTLRSLSDSEDPDPDEDLEDSEDSDSEDPGLDEDPEDSEDSEPQDSEEPDSDEDTEGSEPQDSETDTFEEVVDALSELFEILLGD